MIGVEDNADTNVAQCFTSRLSHDTQADAATLADGHAADAANATVSYTRMAHALADPMYAQQFSESDGDSWNVASVYPGAYEEDPDVEQTLRDLARDPRTSGRLAGGT